jgi:hypothetical protein
MIGLLKMFIPLAIAVLSIICSCQRMTKPLAATTRLSSENSSLVFSDSLRLMRSGAGDTLQLSFETREAANCKISFTVQDAQTSPAQPPVSCSASAATKFSEQIVNVPIDKLVVVHLTVWSSHKSETSSRTLDINEKPPSADTLSINLLMVDAAARRVELTSFEESRKPEEVLASLNVSASSSCSFGIGTFKTLTVNPKSIIIQNTSFKGLFSTSLTRISPTTLAGDFQSLQRDSADWSLSAKTEKGFGQLRLEKPSLIKSSLFAGMNQLSGIEDSLEDLDTPGLKIIGTSSFVATWVVDGSAKDSMATLSIQPSPGFDGVTCRTKGSDGRLVIPSSFISKIPTGKRLWATLRLDSWQALNNERWLVRVSDWTSMGIERL